MKFKDLEIGRWYKNELGKRFFVGENGLLYLYRNNDHVLSIAGLNQHQISAMRFRLSVDYCTLEKAVKWMQDGGKCKFKDSVVYMSGHRILADTGDLKCCGVILEPDLLEQRWELLPKEEH